MSIVTSFTFNEFQENTFVIHDETKTAIIIDPGCNTAIEKEMLRDFIQSNELTVSKVVNTHCHVDHVFGNQFSTATFEAGLFIHKGELGVLQSYPQVAAMYGLVAEPSPAPTGFLVENEILSFGNTQLKILFTPGHSPASVSFYCEDDAYLIGGDVLFQGSIGRTDLPGGNFDILISSIVSSFLTLPDSVLVYCGHGPSTTIGQERKTNPFLQVQDPS